jgi:hypothetical protein
MEVKKGKGPRTLRTPRDVDDPICFHPRDVAIAWRSTVLLRYHANSERRGGVSGERRIEFSKENVCFGHLLKFYHIMRMERRASRSWPVRSFSIWLSVAGSSQRERVGSRPEPVVVRGTVAGGR